MIRALRYLSTAAIALSGAALLGLTLNAAPASGQANAANANITDGRAAFVVSNIAYALARDASETGACPDGMTGGYAHAGDVYAVPGAAAWDQANEEPTLERVLGRMIRGSTPGLAGPGVPNLCQNPELGAPSTTYRTVQRSDLTVEGIDLDGRSSGAGPNTCAHGNFRGANGERGVDNQFYRVLGCNTGFQSNGISNGWAIEMMTGAWGILITLDGVDDLRNDNDVTVGFYANADPIELSPSREALHNATYAIDQDPRFRATTRGRIVNGVLTTDPVDVRFRMTLNGMRLERPLRDARVRMTVQPDGALQGYLGGYTPVQEMYSLQFGFRDGKDGAGQLAPERLRSVSSIGYAITTGHTCEGAYQAILANADGHRDPATGNCTSISTQYRISAVPAFVVDTATNSVNSDLDRAPSRSY